MLSLIFLLAICGAQSRTVYVGSPGSHPCSEKEVPCHSLDYYANHIRQEWVSGTRVVFLPGMHSLSVNLSVVVVNVMNLTLTGMLETVVNCSYNSGFAFSGVELLQIKSVVFSGCGRYSKPGNCDKHVALLFERSGNVKIDDVTVEHSVGYGICGHNIHSHFEINKSLFQYNHGGQVHHGGHMQVFCNSSVCINATLNIIATCFEHGSNLKKGSEASGIAIHLMSANSTVNILIEDSLFQDNSASGDGGHLYIIMHSLNNSINLSNSKFIGGKSYTGGALFLRLSVKSSNSLGNYTSAAFINVQGCVFENNSAINAAGAVYILYHEYAFLPFQSAYKERSVNFSLCTFQHNFVTDPTSPFGTAVYIGKVRTLEYDLRPTPQLSMMFQNCNFSGNSYIKDGGSVISYPCGQICLSDVTVVVIHHSSIFASNCSGIVADRSTIIFGGAVVLSNNTAFRGGAMYLGDGSDFYLTPHANIEIKYNRAKYGGGVYAEQTSQCFLERVECVFQLGRAIQKNLRLLRTVNVTFNQNEAEIAGHDWFGGLLKSCYLLTSFGYSLHHKGSYVFKNVFHFQKRPSFISSTPHGVYFCVHKHISSHPLHVNVYPGQNFTIEVTLVGQYGGSVPGNVVITAESNVRLESLQYLQYVENSSCTNLSLTAYSIKSTAVLTLRADTWCKNSQLFNQSLDISFKKCPIGFELVIHGGFCSCIGQSYFSCDLDGGNIVKPAHSLYWFGFDNLDPNRSVVRGRCPRDYCEQGVVQMRTTSNILYQDVQCLFRRRGLLCGECPVNTSAVVGGSECRRTCSNYFLLLLIPFAAGGLLLVFFIMILDITVSHGAINGLIFYVNIVQVLSDQVFPSTVNHIPVLYQFISWLNLNLGITTCFFNGMGTYSKVWLQWSFPLYVFCLIAVIVLCARRSMFVLRLVGRKATNILATLLLLSFSKIFLSIVSALVFTPLHYHPHGTHWKTVWTLNGNIGYGSEKHIPMILMGVASIFVTLPYITLLLCVQCVRRLNHRLFNWISRLKPLTDAYIGIYKDQCAFWTGHLLLVRAAICAVATFGIVQNEMLILAFVIGACIHILILSIWLFRGVYKHWLLDVLESSFILNICFLCVTTALVMKRSVHIHQQWITYTSVTVAFATFIGIVIYHLHLRLLTTEQYQVFTMYVKRKICYRSEELDPLMAAGTTAGHVCINS